ncbi:MAG: 50S ribosomal protein L6 [Deltaproteobacteria bacterium]|nr:50S ribosomal protein L6 [Deltaproteobacteria bacterium]MCL4874762.1 50S ribosomal protein L6 [bacterium]
MSRIGKQAIAVPANVKVALEGKKVKVTGPQGALEVSVRDEISVEVKDSQITVKRADDSRTAKSLHGLTRTLIANMVKGTSEGFQKKLDIVGVGYKAEVQGNSLNLALGYSHPVKYELPKGISAAVEKQTAITIKGADKQLVGQVAADIRAFRKPEPYKGKGIKYADEVIRRKAGKAGKAGGK